MRFRALCSLFVLAIALTACHSMQVKQASPEDVLKTRVEGYWAARIADDAPRVYEFYAPSYRQKVSLQDFIRAGNIKFKDWRLVEVTIAPTSDSAKIKGMTTMVVNGLEFKDSPMHQSWILVDGVWYLNALTPEESFQKMFTPNPKPDKVKK